MGLPGVGKTTLEQAFLQKHLSKKYIAISVVLVGVKEILEAIERAQQGMAQYSKQTILVVNEIHRFNKS